jgi:transcriptional regulator with XRE-family HTH domain
MATTKPSGDVQIEIGKKIREIRTRLGISIRELAERVGISYLTMQRIETDKISPSIALLASIATRLSYPLSSFLSKERPSVVLIKAQDQNVIRTKSMTLKLVASKGITNENISIVHGKAEKGRLVGRHKHPGFELAYIIKGRALHKQAGNVYECTEGDLIFFDASQWHEVIALEHHEWLGMQFYADTIDLRGPGDLVSEDVGEEG